MNQKERLEEAYQIHSRFHNWMGFLVCDGEEDMLSLRKLVKKIEREAIKKYKKESSKNGYSDYNKIIELVKNDWLDAKKRFNGLARSDYGIENIKIGNEKVQIQINVIADEEEFLSIWDKTL